MSDSFQRRTSAGNVPAVDADTPPRVSRPLVASLTHHRRRLVGHASRVDSAAFARVADGRSLLGPLLPRLSRAADHGVLWWAVAAALGASRGDRRRAAVRGLLAVGVASAAANGPAKVVFRRQRPATHTVPFARRLPRELTTFSFPSGHSASAAAFAAGVAVDAPVAAVPVGALAAAVAFSRVYVGAHYPSDVAAGVALGIGAAAVTTKVMPRRPGLPARARPASAWAPALPDGGGLVVVVNGRAGSGRHEAIVDAIAAGLPAAEIVRVGEGENVGDALASAARRARVLGVAGGDGTVNGAAALALRHRVPLALFPGGTLNHFAADFGLASADDTIEAVRAGSAVAVDVGQISGFGPGGEPVEAVFLNTASLGSYPDMVAVRDRLKDRLGKWPAMAIGLGWVLRHDPPIRLDVDGRHRKLWLIFFGNGIYHPNGFAPTYRRRLDEGLLDQRMVDGTSPLSRTRLVLAVLTGQLRHSRVYEQRSTHQTVLASRDGALPIAYDGEVGQRVTQATVGVSPVCLVVYRPGG